MKFTYLSMLIMIIMAINSLRVNKNHKREDNYQARSIKKDFLQSLLTLDHKDDFMRSIIFDTFSKLMSVTLSEEQKKSLIKSIDYIKHHNKKLKEHRGKNESWIMNGVHINYMLGITSMSHYSNNEFKEGNNQQENTVKDEINVSKTITTPLPVKDTFVSLKTSKYEISSLGNIPTLKRTKSTHYSPEPAIAAAAAFIEKRTELNLTKPKETTYAQAIKDSDTLLSEIQELTDDIKHQNEKKNNLVEILKSNPQNYNNEVEQYKVNLSIILFNYLN